MISTGPGAEFRVRDPAKQFSLSVIVTEIYTINLTEADGCFLLETEGEDGGG